jgi:hypothetical protein
MTECTSDHASASGDDGARSLDDFEASHDEGGAGEGEGSGDESNLKALPDQDDAEPVADTAATKTVSPELSGPIPPGKGRCSVTVGKWVLEVCTYKPREYAGGPILVVLHGVGGNADRYRDYAIRLAKAVDLIVVAPFFDKERFKSWRYQSGGMVPCPMCASVSCTTYVPCALLQMPRHLARGHPAVSHDMVTHTARYSPSARYPHGSVLRSVPSRPSTLYANRVDSLSLSALPLRSGVGGGQGLSWHNTRSIAAKRLPVHGVAVGRGRARLLRDSCTRCTPRARSRLHATRPVPRVQRRSGAAEAPRRRSGARAAAAGTPSGRATTRSGTNVQRI